MAKKRRKAPELLNENDQNMKEEELTRREEKMRKLGGRRSDQPTIEELDKELNMEMDENEKKKLFDQLGWQISKRLPPRFRMAKNDVYICRKTQLAAQFNKCKMLLDRKVDQLVIHALGRAINRALKLALKLEAAMLHSIKLDVQTSSVTVTDDLTSLLDADESTSRERQISSVHILLTRIGEK